MKKMNSKGFTLIELLAVITIMGILMMVAIPSVSRTIENSRRDTFADIAHEYVNAVRNNVLADNIECNTGKSNSASWTTASALPTGEYYFPICTSSGSCGASGALTTANIQTSTTDLMESGGKSPFGNAEVRGYVWFKTSNKKTEYKVFLADTGAHGLSSSQAEIDVKRSNIVVSGAPAKNQETGWGSTTTAAGTQKECKLS